MNKGKAREIQMALEDLPVRVITLADAGIRTPFPEKGTSFEENAREKSIFYSRKSEFLTLAEDSGLEIEALGGAPGVFSARFSGRLATDEKNIQKVLRLMKELPPDKRHGRFICFMVLARRGKAIKTAAGFVRGTVTSMKKGSLGFGYDPIFYYAPLRRTFGELQPREKNAISHRGRALRKMKAFLAGYLKNA
jgi:XTP/dITP diphosphohydrolase